MDNVEPTILMSQEYNVNKVCEDLDISLTSAKGNNCDNIMSFIFCREEGGYNSELNAKIVYCVH
jgi:hypothetical protein